MLSIYLFIFILLIAPQLWIPPFIGIHTDYIIYPLLFLAIAISKNTSQLIKIKIIDFIFIAFVSWLTLSAIANGWTENSQLQVIFYWKMLVMFKLMTIILEDSDRTKRAIYFFIFLTFILSFEAMYHKWNPEGLGWAGQQRGWIDPDALAAGAKGRSRWVGIFEGQGVFAVLFPVCIGFLYCQYQVRKNILSKLLNTLVIISMLGGLICTGSRGGFVSVICITGLYFIFLRSNFKWKYLVLFTGFIIVIFALAPDYLTTIRDQSNSSQYRVEMWAAGLEMLKSNPLFGVGILNFVDMSGKLIAHNSAIEIMAETGLIGLVLWCSLIYYSYKCIIVSMQESKDSKTIWYYKGLFLSLTAYLLSSMFVTLEYETIYIIIAWCVASSIRYIEFNIKDLIRVSAVSLSFIVVVQLFSIWYFR